MTALTTATATLDELTANIKIFFCLKFLREGHYLLRLFVFISI